MRTFLSIGLLVSLFLNFILIYQAVDLGVTTTHQSEEIKHLNGQLSDMSKIVPFLLPKMLRSELLENARKSGLDVIEKKDINSIYVGTVEFLMDGDLIKGIKQDQRVPSKLKFDSVLNSCANEGSHAEMRVCLEEKALNSGATLSATEENVLKHTSTRQEDVDHIEAMKTALKASRQTYADYRDKQCQMYSSMAAGGNAAGDLRLACIVYLNNMQIEQLDGLSNHWK